MLESGTVGNLYVYFDIHHAYSCSFILFSSSHIPSVLVTPMICTFFSLFASSTLTNTAFTPHFYMGEFAHPCTLRRRDYETWRRS